MAKSILDKLAEEVDKITSDQPVAATPSDAGKKAGSKKAAAKKEEKNKIEEEDISTPMGKLLAENTLKFLQAGDVMECKVVDISSSQMVLDLGVFGTGMVIGKEIKDGTGKTGKIKIGSVVKATVVDPENEEGYVELSVREASYENAWDDLESKRDTQENASTKILDANKGGLLVEVNGITGFLPVSQLSSEHYPRVEDGDKNKILAILKRLVGQEITVRIIGCDRKEEKLIVSEKAAISDKEKAVISELKKGDIIEGEVSGVVDFGAFVKFLPPSKKDSTEEKDKLEGLVHISELAWQLIQDPREIIKAGDKVQAQIIGIDETRISLSFKALQKDPWSEIGEKYVAGSVVSGKVDKINPFGAFVYLDKDIHGLAHVSEFKEVYPEQKMEEFLKVGEAYQWKIISIEPKEHRMGLMIVKEEAKAEKKTKDKKVKNEVADEELVETKEEVKKPARNATHSVAGGEKKSKKKAATKKEE